MITWGEFRAQIQRSILKDENGSNWKPNQLRDYLHWSLDALCTHTALATSTGYQGDGETTEFALPSNVFSSVESEGVVYIVGPSKSVRYLEPIRFAKNVTAMEGNYSYMEWPRGTLRLGIAPASNEVLRVDYFAYYPKPYDDQDLILVPDWALPALSYHIGAHAMTALATRSGNLNQWKDTGDPEKNALRAMQKWLMQMYREELAAHPMQDRTTLFRGNRR